MNTTWRNDWDVFLKCTTELLRKGVTVDELSKRFGGAEVTWQGVVDEKHLNGLAPSVGITMAQTQVDLGARGIAAFAGLNLPIAEDSARDWEQLIIGSRVKFTAHLVGAGTSMFPPIEIKTLSTGRIILDVRVTGGRPVS